MRGPIFNHLGVTTNPLSEQKKAALPVPSNSTGAVRAGLTVGTSAHGQAAAPDEPNEDEDGVPDPEMSEDDLFDLIAFVMLLAAPQADELDETLSAAKRSSVSSDAKAATFLSCSGHAVFCPSTPTC